MSETDLPFLSDQAEIDTQSLFFSTLLIYPDIDKKREILDVVSQFVGDVKVADNGDQAISILENEFLELVILSLSQKDIASIHVLNTIQHFRPGLPILVLADQHSLQDTLIALREGAWDFVIEDGLASFTHSMHSSLQRMAERKLSVMRNNSFQSERLAFWSAVQRAQDGLGIIGTSGKVSFANPCFLNFIKLLSSDVRTGETLDIVYLIAQHDIHIAEQLKTALNTPRLENTIWRSELKVIPRSELDEPITRYFQIDLSSMSMFESDSISLENQRHVLWVSDITNIKEHEQFQREVISTTSHDLKGPLSTISSAAELILDLNDVHSESTVKLLQLIMSAAMKSQKHIEEFLSAKRIEAGVITVEPYLYNLYELINDMVNEYQPAAQSRDITITCQVKPSEREIFADKLAFYRVMGNVLSNAIKYTPEFGRVDISVEERDGLTVIHVADSGNGINQNSLHNLFDKYSRLKEHSSISGSGLGLFIVKSIMEAHKGKVEVQSIVGKGTIFSLFFPDKLKS